jgi:hypothetical protein
VQNGGTSYGQSFVKMSPSLQVEDWFAPVDYLTLNRGDVDLGSGGPLIIPGTTPPMLVGGGKEGIIYLVNSSNMGKLGETTDTNTQEWQATNSIYGAPIVWTGATDGSPRYYLWGMGDPLKEWVYSNPMGMFPSTTPAYTTSPNDTPRVNGQDPVGSLAVSSNGTTAGTGIVWATRPTTNANPMLANPDHMSVPGTFYAFDALTLTDIWDTTQNPTRDALGYYAKFVPPTIANGKVYVATFAPNPPAGQVVTAGIVVYGLLDMGADK